MINRLSCSNKLLLQLSFFWLENLRMIHTLSTDWWNLSEPIHPVFIRSLFSLAPVFLQLCLRFGVHCIHILLFSFSFCRLIQIVTHWLFPPCYEFQLSTAILSTECCNMPFKIKDHFNTLFCLLCYSTVFSFSVSLCCCVLLNVERWNAECYMQETSCPCKWIVFQTKLDSLV